MINLTVIGDDLTGTADCVSLGVACGCTVRMEIDCTKNFLPPNPGRREILGINIATRSLTGSDAKRIAKTTAEKMKSEPNQIIVKKMDTGFRGNAAFEIEGMLEALGKDLCFILEHIPIRKTFTLYGHQYSGGQILNKSVFASDDRLKSQKKSYIPDILAEDTLIPIGTVNIDAVKKGRILTATKEQIIAGKKIIVFDVITFEDGMNIINALINEYPQAMWAGSTGIVENLIVHTYGSMDVIQTKVERPLCIGFSGTAYRATQKQLSIAAEATGLHIVEINIDRVLDQDESVYEEVVQECLTYNGRGKDVLVKQHLSSERESTGVNMVILNALCKCAKLICKRAKFDRIVIIGGETSQAIFKELEINTLDMFYPPAIGAATGAIEDGPYAGKTVSIKGGSIGPDDVIIRLLGK